MTQLFPNRVKGWFTTGSKSRSFLQMLVFWEKNLVYLAVPKTGTTAFAAALDPIADIAWRQPPALKHSHAYRFHTFVRPALDRVERKSWDLMAVIRHPTSWLGSWYRYRQRDALKGTDRFTKGLDFETFVGNYLSPDPPEHAKVGRQSFMVLADGGKPLVTHLFAYEQQAEIRAFLEQRLECNLSISRHNTSPKASDALSPGMTQRLERERQEEFALHELARQAGARGGALN